MIRIFLARDSARNKVGLQLAKFQKGKDPDYLIIELENTPSGLETIPFFSGIIPEEDKKRLIEFLEGK